eukprot:9328084-Pyramimonas_sp.AAC.1
MREIIEFWHSNLSPEVEVKVVTALQKLASLQHDMPLSRWSVCAGTGISTWWAGGSAALATL